MCCKTAIPKRKSFVDMMCSYSDEKENNPSLLHTSGELLRVYNAVSFCWFALRSFVKTKTNTSMPTPNSIAIHNAANHCADWTAIMVNMDSKYRFDDGVYCAQFQ